MYRKAISELPSADALTGQEFIAVVQDGKTKKVSLSQSVSSVGQVYTSDTPPSSPFEGQLWFNTTKSRLYSWNVGSSSSQWIQV